MVAMREAYGRELAEYACDHTEVVVLDADTSSSTLSKYFAQRYPERFINVGIAEQCLMDVAAGLALGGRIPFVNAFAALISLRALEQVRTCICYARTNVKIAAGYAGLSDFKDGPTHHSITDIAIMRAMPEMTVIVPSDAQEAASWVPIVAEHDGPVYLRLSRALAEPYANRADRLEIGKGLTLLEGRDVTLIGVGAMVGRCIQAAERLSENGINARVLAMPSVKPLDAKLVLEAAEKTGAIVTAEEHSIIGGLGEAVSSLLSENHPLPIERVGIKDCFTRTALSYESLMDAYGLGVTEIEKKTIRVIKRKRTCRI